MDFYFEFFDIHVNEQTPTCQNIVLNDKKLIFI
jgi:hypothetical protein